MSEKENAISHHKGNISKYFDFNFEMLDFYFFFQIFFYVGFRASVLN